MRIAVTSTGPDLDSKVDERFGRACYIIFIDAETGDFEAMDNRANMDAAQGAGVQTAHEVSIRNTGWVLTGHVGPKAFQALNTAGIKISTGAAGTVAETVKRFNRGEFTPVDSADAEGRSKWG